MLLLTSTTQAKVTCEKRVQNLPLIDVSNYLSIQVDKDEKETIAYGKNTQLLDKKYKHCLVLAHYFSCKPKNVIVPGHYKVINYFSEMEVWIPEHTETKYLFNKKLYALQYYCEKKIASTIREMLIDHAKK